MRRQFAKNLTSNWAVYFASAVTSFFLTPYIIGRLGQAAFGVWVLVGSFSGYLGLFDFGIGYAVVRYVARFQQTGQPDKRNEVVATAFYTALLLSLLVMAATLYIMYNAAAFFDIPPELAGQSRTVIFLIGLSIAAGFPLSVFSEALAGGLWRYDLFNGVALLMGLLRAGLTILLLERGWGLAGLGAAGLAGSLLAYLWRMRLLYRLLPDLSIKFRFAKRAVIKMMGGYSLFSFLLVLSGRIAFYSDSFVVGIFLGVNEVAVFGIASKLTEYLRQMVFTMTRLFSPVASRYDPETDQASLRRIFYDGSRLNLLFSLPLSLFLFFWGGPLIHLWVGEAFEASAVILQVLLAGHLLSFVQGIGGEILLGVGRHRVLAVLSTASALINIALSVILVKQMGLVGVAWGTTIPLAVLSLGYVPAATLKLVGGRPRELLNEVIRPAALAALAPGAAIVLTARLITSVTAVLVWGIPIAALTVAAAYLVGLKPAEREKLRTEIIRRTRRV